MKGKFNGSIKNTLTHSVCALAVLAATSMPAMAESVDLAVKGTIIPAACVPSIIGEIDYGNVTAVQLDDNEYTVLDIKEVDFAIDCGGMVKVAIKAINGKPGTVAGSIESGESNTALTPVEVLGSKNIRVAGLGAADGKNIGGYAVGLVAAGLMADAKPMFLKASIVGSVNWNGMAGTYVSLYSDLLDQRVRSLSWSDTRAQHNPSAVTNLTGKLAVQAYLNTKSELDPSKAIQLNGLTTVELVYL